MSDGANYMKYGVIGVPVPGIGLVAWRKFGPAEQPGQSTQIVAPRQLSAAASLGKNAFDDNSAQCHGANAAGACFVAVANGFRQHHWRFGIMAPMPQVGADQTRMIIAYVRELQQANGIFYKPN